MPRWRTLGLRLIIVVFLIVVAGWGSMWAYVGYEAHRTKLLLSEISQIHLGDTEASILPLVERYGGFKWSSGPLSPQEDWIDKDDYEYQKARASDYAYALEVNPFASLNPYAGRFAQVMGKLRTAVPAPLRPMLGMRDWLADTYVSVRGGRVQSVGAITVFGGRSSWLGHGWRLSEGMPEHDMRQKTYAVGGGALTMGEGGGAIIENYFTPEASEEEAQAARQFNTKCLTSIRGCKNFCDVAPRALDYLKNHPDAIWSIIPPDCP
jgi:hypothetical protein